MGEKSGIMTIVAVLIIGVLVGAGVMYFAMSKTTSAINGVQECKLTQADINYLTNVSIVTGFCERLGVQSSLFLQYDKDTNRTYGVPVCVQGS